MRRSAATPVARGGLSTQVDGAVAWLRLDRPAAGNCITPELAQALCDAAAEIELDDRVAVVVLAATGASFCLGVETHGVEDRGDSRARAWEQRVDWVDAIGRLTRPVIAAVQGDAIAEGLELALACDLRLLSTAAHVAMPQLTLGRLPVHGGTQRLPRIVGRMRALDLLLTGRSVDACEAEAIGLASRVAAPEDVAVALETLIAAVQSKGPTALRYAKEAVLAGSDLTLDQGVRLEQDLYVLLQTTQDRREGIDAFLKKRAPVFTGK